MTASAPAIEPLRIACVSDLSGQVRGKGYPDAQRARRLVSGVGWTPANALITCFDTIAPSPYGAFGDLVLRPSADASIEVAYASGRCVRLALGNVTDTEGNAWECCLRGMAQAALARLQADTGLRVLVAFEHEFVFDAGTPTGGAYSLEGFLREQDFGEALMGALRQAGLQPDTFLREYGRGQYEVTVDPAIGVAAADQAVILRELVRTTAREFGRRASFAPLLAPGGIGNGVHVHLSLLDDQDRPVAYDPAAPHGLSAVAASFVAGMLAHLPSFVALTAPSVVSYQRLVPHRWSAAFNNLGYRDREAAVRICPLSARDRAARARPFNVEFRAADAAASPHLVLAALVSAGAQGVADALPLPHVTQDDLSTWSVAQLAGKGLQRLPSSLAEALAAFEGDAAVRSWFPPGFADLYLAHKRGEIAFLEGRDDAGVCAAYLEAY
jgi:glutamine synthetase